MERISALTPGTVRAYHEARYRLARLHAPGRRVLDVACGDGYGSALLAGVAEHVTSVEPLAKPAYELEAHVKAYAEELAFKEQFDLVVSFETIEHSISPRLFLFKLWEALRPGGHLLLSFPNGWGETAFHLHDTRARTLGLVAEFFHVREVFGQNRRTQIEPTRIPTEGPSAFWVENIIVLAERGPGPSEPVRLFDEVYRAVQEKQLQLRWSIVWQLRRLGPLLATAVKRRLGRPQAFR